MLLRKSMLLILFAACGLAFITGCESDTNLVPVITRIETTHTCGVAPLNVQFVAIASGGNQFEASTGGNSWLETRWDFGDGGTGTNSITLHRFEEPGDYIVVATVTDIDGDSHNMTVPVEVRGSAMTITTVADTSVVASWTRFPVHSMGGPNPGSGDTRKSGVVFNEMLIFNQGAAIDPDNTLNTTTSCVELYNNSDETVMLEGWLLTNNPWIGQNNTDDVPIEWRFPEGVEMAPYSYEVIWFDSRNSVGNDLHAGFKILVGYSGTPAQFDSRLFLVDDNNNHVDYVAIKNQALNVSFGRIPDAGESGQVPLDISADLCGFTGEDVAYDRFEYLWSVDDEFSSRYLTRRPSHTFTTADVGVRSIIVELFDTHTSVTRNDTITVEVISPYDTD